MKKRIAAALCLALALCLLASCGKGQLRVEVWRRTADPERALSESVIQPETRTVQLQAGSVNGAVSAFNAEPEDPTLRRARPRRCKDRRLAARRHRAAPRGLPGVGGARWL